MQYSSILAGPYDMVICILKQHNSSPISHSDNTLMFSLPVLHGDSLSQAPHLLAHQTQVNITLVWPSNMGQGRYIMCILHIRIIQYWHYLPCSLYQTCLVRDSSHRQQWKPAHQRRWCTHQRQQQPHHQHLCQQHDYHHHLDNGNNNTTTSTCINDAATTTSDDNDHHLNNNQPTSMNDHAQTSHHQHNDNLSI